jgi:hypothetical protein
MSLWLFPSSTPLNANSELIKLRVLRLGSDEDGNVWVGVFPDRQEILICGAGRAVSAVDVANGINSATAASYSAAGALLSLKNGASLTSTLYYNNRLEPCRISGTTASNFPSQCSDTANLGNVLDFSYNYNAGTANNGDVMQIASNLNSSRTQTFTYDQLNRITSAGTSAPPEPTAGATNTRSMLGQIFSRKRVGHRITMAAAKPPWDP